MPQLDFEFSDPKTGLTETPNSCYFATVMQSHPRLPLTVRREWFRAGVHAGPHQHCDFFALYLIRGGRGIHEINGEKHELSRGDAYLLAPGSVHGYRDYRDLSLDGFYFPFELLERREIEALSDLPGFGALFRGEHSAGARVLRLSRAQHDEFEPQIEALRREYGGQNRAADFLLRAGFFSLLIQLARIQNAPPAATRAPFGHALGVAEVRKFCEQTRGDLPTPTQMARWMCLSDSHFRAVWKSQTGASPSEFLRALRLVRAREKLESGLPVAQVARSEGFADSAHFCRAFKAAYGATPRGFFSPKPRTNSSKRAA